MATIIPSWHRAVRSLCALLSVLFIVVFNSSAVQAQVPEQQWSRYPTASFEYNQKSMDIVNDASGNVYATASRLNASGNYDFCTVKYNHSGMMIWTKMYNGPDNGDDNAVAIRLDNLGNVYVTGQSYSETTKLDLITLKYNSSGSLIWERRFNAPATGNDIPADMVIDEGNNIIIVGKSEAYTGLFFHDDIRIIKYNSLGTLLWSRFYNNASGYDAASAVSVDAVGNIYVTGESWTDNLPMSEPASAQTDFITLKFNPAGEKLWHRLYYYDQSIGFNWEGPDGATDIAVDQIGNVIVTGVINFGTDVLTIKYSAAGDTLWTYNLGEGSGYGVSGLDPLVAIDSRNNIILYFGSIESDSYTTMKFSPAGSQLWVKDRVVVRVRPDGTLADISGVTLAVDASDNIYVGGIEDRNYFIIKYSPMGSQKWVKKFEGPGSTFEYGIQKLTLDSFGNIYMAGWRKDFSTALTANFLIVKYHIYTPTLPLLSTVRVNAGGPTVTTGGKVFSRDSYFSPAATVNRASTVLDIAGTTDDIVYQTWREAAVDWGTFSYSIPVYNGTYRVALHFVENFHNSPGRRVSNVNLEGGTRELTNWDVFAAVGANKAAVKTYDVTVFDEVLNIFFESLAGRAMISAIEVLPLSGARVMAEQTVKEVEGLEVVPNPFSHILRIQLPDFPKDVVVQIKDIMGKVRYDNRHILINGSSELDLNFLAPGVYILKVTGSERISKSLRIIKN